ncbi:MAG: PilN domain-containing protein [Nitrospirae bacterium]|nr:PilN domain-containing protein [Candidatus Manganitrophaceae bacterium]
MDRFTINLASGDFIKRRAVGIGLSLLALVLIFLIGLDVLQFFNLKESNAAFDLRIGRVLKEKQQLQGEIGKMGRNVSDDSEKSMQKEIRVANQLLKQRRFSWTTFLSDLEGRVPSKVSVTRVQPDFNSGLVVLGGVAPSLKEVTQFVGRLQSDPFEEVFLTEQGDLEKEGKKGVNFSIRFKYNSRREGK